ncbi:MAG: MATE family efflux transporter [Thermoplasmata archaeon]
MELQETYLFLKSKMGRPDKEEIISGNIIPVLFKLGWPMMLSSLLQTTYNLIDTMWLGRLPAPHNELAVGALSLAWPFVMLMVAIEMGLGIAGIALISQNTGAKRYGEARKDAGQMYFIFILFSILLGGVGFLIAEPFLALITESGSPMVGPAAAYIRIIFLGFPALITFAAFTFSLRAWGDTITPTVVMGVGIFANIILDPVFIFGAGPVPAMGIRGAAVATTLSRTMCLLIAVHLLYHRKVGLWINLSHLKPDWYRIKKFFQIGIPATIARAMDSSEFLIFAAALTYLPMHTTVVAAYGIGGRILGISFVVMWGLGMALTTVVGQSLGAEKTDRADEAAKKGMLIMMVLMSGIALFLVAFRFSLFGFFIKDRPEVVQMGGEFLLILAIGAPFFAIFEAVSATLNGSGHTKQQLGISITRLWALRIPLLIILAFVIGLNSTGAWLAIALSNVISGTIAYVVYRLGWWKKKIIDKDPFSKNQIPR